MTEEMIWAAWLVWHMSAEDRQAIASEINPIRELKQKAMLTQTEHKDLALMENRVYAVCEKARKRQKRQPQRRWNRFRKGLLTAEQLGQITFRPDAQDDRISRLDVWLSNFEWLSNHIRSWLGQQEPEISEGQRLEEKNLYPLVQKYFQNQELQCWPEETLRTIQKRSRWGRFQSEGYPTPDLVAADAHELIAVEIKRDTSPGKLDDCIGKLMRMLRFANKVYGAFLSPISKSTIETFRVLRKSIPRAGLLEIDPEKRDRAVTELVAAAHGEPDVKIEARRYLLELIRAKSLDEKKQYGSKWISDLDPHPDQKLVFVKINDPVEDVDLAEEVIVEDCTEIDDAIHDLGLRTMFGEETDVRLVSEYWETCTRCRHVKVKEYACPNCDPNLFKPYDSWAWGRPVRSEEDEI
jgi:hypothetical protein